MSRQNMAWRRQGVGGTMFATADRLVKQKMEYVYANGFPMVGEVLMALFQNLDMDGTRLTDLADRARMTKPSMLELVDRAEAMKLVVRRPDPDDGRAKLVMFTELGLTLLEVMHQGVALAERRLARSVGASFMREMKRELCRYVNAESSQLLFGENLRLSPQNDEWRLSGVGRVLTYATDIYLRHVLNDLHEAGRVELRSFHLSLFRQLDLTGTRLTELAARANMTKPAMLDVVNKAEALGFVERHADPTDGRAKIVRFTEQGLELLNVLRQTAARAERHMAQTTSTEFVAALKAQLYQYIHAAALAA